MCNYTRWEIGGEPQRSWYDVSVCYYYTRWEIGGEPQRSESVKRRPWIIPDGRSGGNRNRRQRLPSVT